jgi:DNA processing protein
MALIVHASVIVEAGESSGSLSQGWEALRLGRPLLLLRSLVERTDLKWPQTMLDYGAQVLDSPDDLFALLPSRASDDDLAAIA